MSLALLGEYDSDSSQQSVADAKQPVHLQPPPDHSPSITSQAADKSQTPPSMPSPENSKNGQHAQSHVKTTDADIPAELAAELRLAGHDLADVNFIDVNATINVRVANSNDHIPASALRNTATRLAQQISKSRNVGRMARRKHQITALAADALALQAAHAVLPGSASQRKR